MLLPQTAEYAIRAVLHIAAQGRAVRVNEIAGAIDVPRNYLSKTLHQLARDGVLASTRGPLGGFQLAVPANELTLERIVALFSAPAGGRCLLRPARCGEHPVCAVHDRWAPVASTLRDFFGATTVADLLSEPSSTS
jgi:Rrf2 family protein